MKSYGSNKSIANKSLLLVLVVITLITTYLSPSVSADLKSYPTGSCVPIRVLSNCSNVNLTEVTNLNMTYIINKQMTKLGGQTFNYSFCNTSLPGEYTYSWSPVCQDCTNVDCGNYFTITATGQTLDTSKSIVLLFIIGILIFITVLLFIFGLKAEIPIIKIFCLGLAVLLLIFSVGFIMSVANITISEFGDLTNVFTNIYIMFIALISVGAIGLILYLIYFAFQSFYKYRGFK